MVEDFQWQVEALYNSTYIILLRLIQHHGLQILHGQDVTGELWRRYSGSATSRHLQLDFAVQLSDIRTGWTSTQYVSVAVVLPPVWYLSC